MVISIDFVRGCPENGTSTAWRYTIMHWVAIEAINNEVCLSAHIIRNGQVVDIMGFDRPKWIAHLHPKVILLNVAPDESQGLPSSEMPEVVQGYWLLRTTLMRGLSR